MKLPKPNALFWLIFFGVLISDQITKYLIVNNYSLHESTPVIEGFLNITRVHNTGIAFGMLQGHNSWLAIALIGLLIFGVWIAGQMDWSRRYVQIACALILAGGIGNGIDRWNHNAVIDFVDVYWKHWHWPAFNVADSAICIAVGLLLIDEWRASKNSESQ